MRIDHWSARMIIGSFDRSSGEKFHVVTEATRKMRTTKTPAILCDSSNGEDSVRCHDLKFLIAHQKSMFDMWLCCNELSEKVGKGCVKRLQASKFSATIFNLITAQHTRTCINKWYWMLQKHEYRDKKDSNSLHNLRCPHCSEHKSEQMHHARRWMKRWKGLNSSAMIFNFLTAQHRRACRDILILVKRWEWSWKSMLEVMTRRKFSVTIFNSSLLCIHTCEWIYHARKELSKVGNASMER